MIILIIMIYSNLENNWDSTRDLIGQKPMVYYTGKPMEESIRTGY